MAILCGPQLALVDVSVNKWKLCGGNTFALTVPLACVPSIPQCSFGESRAAFVASLAQVIPLRYPPHSSTRTWQSQGPVSSQRREDWLSHHWGATHLNHTLYNKVRMLSK